MLFWIIVIVAVVALGAYLLLKKKGPSGPSKPQGPAQTPPTQGPTM